MITILVGNDQHAIEREITAFKAKTNPRWRDFNFHRFPSEQLESAMVCALTGVFGDGQKLVVVENCDFRQFGETGLSILQCLSRLPETTHLVFVAPSIEKRLKVSKHLLKHGKLMEFTLIPPWRTDLIAGSIKAQAKELNLRLTPEVVNYLAEAIGNDTARSYRELTKLAVYANGNRVTQAQAEALVPCTTQTNLQLAEAVRQGKAALVASLLNELLAQAEFPLVIVATLITQFRTWLWVKAAIASGLKSDSKIAQLCGVGNPKRMYFLRSEVKDVSVRAAEGRSASGSLCVALTLLLDLEVSLKNGARTETILPALLRIVQLMKPSRLQCR
ncbi:MAG: DNA polymerase III subunit delta [Xenococcaceae cyanobacterium]